MATPLLHLGLLVRDQQRSLGFYATYFGFASASARRYPDGTVIVRNPQGFDLALPPGDPPERLPAFVHFGFQLPDATAVRALPATMEADEEPDRYPARPAMRRAGHGWQLAPRSVQQSNHCAREDFLYELRPGSHTTVTGRRPHPPPPWSR